MPSGGPRRPLSRVAAMALTGANVGLRQVIAAAILVHIVVLFPLPWLVDEIAAAERCS
jgi:hypothetical protein